MGSNNVGSNNVAVTSWAVIMFPTLLVRLAIHFVPNSAIFDRHVHEEILGLTERQSAQSQCGGREEERQGVEKGGLERMEEERREVERGARLSLQEKDYLRGELVGRIWGRGGRSGERKRNEEPWWSKERNGSQDEVLPSINNLNNSFTYCSMPHAAF